jgi:uncharacterized protein (TIGR00297 family)
MTATATPTNANASMQGKPSRRRWVHAAMLAFAFLLRWLRPWQAQVLAAAAIAFNSFILPRLPVNLGKRERNGLALSEGREATEQREIAGSRSEKPLVPDRFGLVLYPTTVLLLLLLFGRALWIAAAGWAILALGDPLAAVIGEDRRLRWWFNRRKSPAGTVAYWLAGWCGALAFAAYMHAPWSPALLVAATGAAAAMAAAVEALPSPLDDNLTAPLAGCAVIAIVAALHANAMPALLHLQQRWLAALAVSAIFALAARLMRLVDTSAAAAGLGVSSAIWLGVGSGGFACLLAFFVTASLMTRLRYALKPGIAPTDIPYGRRASQVLANGIVAAALALGAMISSPPLAGVLSLAVVAALAEAAADTIAGEAGQAFSSRAWMIGTFRSVPVGTDGGISPLGTLAGLAASLLVAAVGSSIGLLPDAGAFWLVVIAANAGHLLDSVFGGWLQRHGWVDNDAVNFLGTFSAALIVLLPAVLPS